MINLANNTTVVADNKVTFCGLEYLVTDKEAQQLKSIIEGFISTRNNSNTVVNTPVDTPVAKAEKQYKDVAKHVDGFSYKVEKLVDRKSGKSFFCIGYVAPNKCYMTKDLKSKVNSGIKAIKGITTIEVAKDNGGKFNAWGFATKASAEKHIASLPTSFDYIQKELVK